MTLNDCTQYHCWVEHPHIPPTIRPARHIRRMHMSAAHSANTIIIHYWQFIRQTTSSSSQSLVNTRPQKDTSHPPCHPGPRRHTFPLHPPLRPLYNVHFHPTIPSVCIYVRARAAPLPPRMSALVDVHCNAKRMARVLLKLNYHMHA